MDKKKDRSDLELNGEYEKFIKECQDYVNDMDEKEIPHLCLPSKSKSEKLRKHYADIVNNSNLIPPYRKASYLEVSLRLDATEGECMTLFQTIDDSQRGPFFVGTCMIRLVDGNENMNDSAVYRVVIEYMQENQDHMRVILVFENEEQMRKIDLYADSVNIRHIDAMVKNRTSDIWEKNKRRIGFI